MNAKISSIGLISLIVFTSCGNKQDHSRAQTLQEYPVMTVTEQTEVLESVYPATIRGREDIEIRPRVDGFIDAIYVDEGSIVKKGQALFKINSPQAEQALTSAQAAMKSAQAQVNTAKTNVDRVRPLAEKNIVSRVQLTTAEDAYQTALAGLAQAEAAVKNAQATVSWTNVTSPVNGLVGEIPFRLGSLVNSNHILTTVSNTSNVYAYFSMDEVALMQFLDQTEGRNPAEKIANLPAVTLTLKDKSTYPEKGKVETIAGIANLNTGSTNFRVEFPNKQGVLRSGTTGVVSIPRVIEKAIVIPQKATFAQQDKQLAYKVLGDSVVQTLLTVIPTPDGKNYVVTNGLSAGDRVVTDGIITLSNGKKIIAK